LLGVTTIWPFSEKAFLDREEEEWQIEAWSWMLCRFGGLTELGRVRLATPAPGFFPPTDATGHARAEQIFASVKALAGMSDWPCRLVAQPDAPELRVGDVAALKILDGKRPLVTFGLEGNEIVITYEPAAIREPITLIATFAHELAHYRIRSLGDRPPGGDELEEFATDLVTVYMGFGIFGANSAFSFRQFRDVMSQGWSSSRSGYLSQRAWVFAMAVFFALRSQSPMEAIPYLKPHLATDLVKASRYLGRHPTLLEALRREFPSPV
jgi:hypothetical protein